MFVYYCFVYLEGDRGQTVDGGADGGQGAREYARHGEAGQPRDGGHPGHDVERQQLVPLSDNACNRGSLNLVPWRPLNIIITCCDWVTVPEVIEYAEPSKAG